MSRETTIKAVIYYRTSGNSAGENKMLENQEAICRQYAVREGYQVVSVIIDVVPHGLTLDRDGMNVLIKCIQRHEIATVIVKDFDRIARKMEDTQRFHALCEKHEVDILSVVQDIAYRDSISALIYRSVADGKLLQ